MVRSIFACPAGRSLSFSGMSPNRGTPGIFFLRSFSLRSFSAACALIASCSRCMASSAFCSFDLITMGCTPVSSILCDGGVTICGFFKVAATRGRTWSLGRGWMTSCRVSFSCSFSENPASVSRLVSWLVSWLVPWLASRLVSFLDSSRNLFCVSFFPIALPYFLFNCKEPLLSSIILLFSIVLSYFDSADIPEVFFLPCSSFLSVINPF